jgi:hypothetical protein
MRDEMDIKALIEIIYDIEKNKYTKPLSLDITEENVQVTQKTAIEVALDNAEENARYRDGDSNMASYTSNIALQEHRDALTETDLCAD